MKKLLTLDLATNLGYTVGEPDDLKFSSGSFRLPSTGQDIGRFIEAYDDWLQPMLAGVMMTVFEAPILPRETQLATVRKLHGLCSHTEYRCRSFGIEVMEAHGSSVKAFMGGGRMKKEQMVEMVRLYGYKPGDDDEADAIAVRLYAIQRRFPRSATKFSAVSLGPLGGAALSQARPEQAPVPAR